MNILVTGGAGYVGSVLIQELIKEGHNVKCLDRFFFGKEFLAQDKFKEKVELIQDDIRWFDASVLNDLDIVMDLAALSNDPVGDLAPQKTYEINHKGRVRVAQFSKKAKVKHYVLASSASVYGQQEDIVDEDSEVNPITDYSKANRMAELDVLPLNDIDFTVTILRFSSIYGLSPRMRFDLAVNSMVLELFKTGKIVVRGETNRRPFLHINDAIRAYKMIIECPKEQVSGQIINVGSDDQNYEILKLAHKVGDSLGKKYELETKDTRDHRSFSASFKKIQSLGFKPKFTISDATKEIYQALLSGEVIDSKKTITVEWYKYLLESAELLDKVRLDGKLL